MRKIIKEDLCHQEGNGKRKAIKLMKEIGEEYKVELIEEMEDEEVSFYEQGEFMNLCMGLISLQPAG